MLNTASDLTTNFLKDLGGGGGGGGKIVEQYLI